MLEVAPLEVIQWKIKDTLDTMAEVSKKKELPMEVKCIHFGHLLALCQIINLELAFKDIDDFYIKIRAIADRWDMEAKG